VIDHASLRLILPRRLILNGGARCWKPTMTFLANRKESALSSDYDSPGKEALDAYYEPFLALLFPQVHRHLDRSRGCESRDKEFKRDVLL
jgi:hypothetical protein